MATAPTTTAAPAAPAPAPTTSGTAPAPAPTKGHNSGTMTNDAITALGSKVGELLANAVMRTEKVDKERDAALTYREEAAQELFPALDTILKLTPESRDKFDATKAKEDFPQYETLRVAVCRAISQRLKDAVVEQKPGKDGVERSPKFSQRVSKAFSRLVTSYRTGGDGGQTDADKAARQAEKERKQAYKDMASALADIITAYTNNDTEALNAQVKAAVARWPARGHGTLFPKKG